MTNKKDSLVQEVSEDTQTPETTESTCENTNNTLDVSDTQVIDTEQLKELSANTVAEIEKNAQEPLEAPADNSGNKENVADTKTDIDSDDTISKEESVDTDTDSDADEDDFVEGQLNMFDDEDDFSSPDDGIEDDNENDNDNSNNNINNDDDSYKFEFNFSIPARAKKWIIGIVSLILIFFIAAYIVAINTLPKNTIYKNVYIEDINVGGMTYEQALETLSSATLFESQDINLSYNSRNYTIDGDSIGLEASLEATAKKAYNYGKTGNKFLDGFYNMVLMFKRHTIMPVANIDTAKLDEQITKFGIACLGELKQHNIVVQADGLVYIGPGITGFDNNVKPARDKILSSLKNDRYSGIKVPLSSAPPNDITIEAFDAAVYCDPIDSYYEYSDSDVTIVPEVSGRYINKEEAKPLLEQVKEGEPPVYIPWYKSEAAITSQMMEEKLFTATLGSYSTYYGGTYNRNKNVERAASLMNGAVLPPGGVFSFNDRVGPRTVANGFYTAPEYANGETVMGIGGGTCQVSTTLYGAILYADMDIVSRTEHMFPVGYAPLGQDATVYYGSLDFKFKNSSDYPIKIVATTSGGKITVDILGAAWDPAKKIELKHSGGRSYVSSKRLVYDADGNLLETETLPSSSYRSH